MADKIMAEIIRGLASGSCPDLRRLYASSQGIGREASLVLVDGLGAHAWPTLEELDVAIERKAGEGWLGGFAGALADGAGGHLVSLTVTCPVSLSGLGRFCDALRRGACPRLQDLSMVGVPVGEGVNKKVCIEQLERALAGRAVLDVEWTYGEDESDSEGESCDDDDENAHDDDDDDEEIE